MDPDANLREQRDLLRSYRRKNRLTALEAGRLVELVDALDGWISNGGFLPEAWQRVPERLEGAEAVF